MPGASQSIRSRFVISVVLLLSLFFLLASAVHFAQRQVQRLVTEATEQQYAAAAQLLRFALALEGGAQSGKDAGLSAGGVAGSQAAPAEALAILDTMMSSARFGFTADEHQRLSDWRHALSGPRSLPNQRGSRPGVVVWMPRDIGVSALRLSERKTLAAAQRMREAEARFQFLDLLLLALCAVAAMVALVVIVMVPSAISRPVDALIRRLDGVLGEQNDDWQQAVKTGVTELNRLSDAVERVRGEYKQLKRDRER